MSANCEKDFEIPLIVFEWSLFFAQGIGSGCDGSIAFDGANGAFDMVLNTGVTTRASIHALCAASTCVHVTGINYQESNIVGPFAVDYDLVMTGNTHLEGGPYNQTDFPACTPVANPGGANAFLWVEDPDNGANFTDYSVSLPPSLSNTSSNTPVNVTHTIPAGERAFLYAGLDSTGTNRNNTLVLSFALFPSPPP